MKKPIAQFLSVIYFPGESIRFKFILSQSELFRFIPISVSEAMWIIPNQSEKRFVSRLMKNGQKPIRLNPINSETLIRMNPTQSESKFSIRINPNHFDFGFIRIDSDWKFGLDKSEIRLIWIDLDWKLDFGLVGIHSDCCLGSNRIRSDRFFYCFSSNELQNVFRIGSEWFALARIQISE